MNKLLVGTAIGLLLGVGLFSFYGGSSDSKELEPRDKQTLVACDYMIAESYDPLQITQSAISWDASDVIYNQLLVNEPMGSDAVINDVSLAESYEYLNDGLIVRVKLKPNVAFHTTPWFTPTRTLTSDDVVFSFMRALDKNHPHYKAAEAGYQSFEALGLSDILKEVKRVDDLTVDFVLKQKDATFIQSLAASYNSIMSAEYADKLLKENKIQDIAHFPVGTGAFVFVESKKGQSNRYKRFDNFFAANMKPKFTNLVRLAIKEPRIRLEKAKLGECDVVYDRFPLPEIASQVLNSKHFSIVTSENVSTTFTVYNNKRLNKQLRQALLMGWDRAALRAIEGAGTPSLNISRGYSILPKTQWGFLSLPSNDIYDFEKAKRLVQESGYKNQPIIYLMVPDESGKKKAQFFVEQYKKIGLNVEVKFLEFGTLYETLISGNYDIGGFNWQSDNGDPDNFVSLFTCKQIGMNNNAHYCNPKYDSIVEKARQELDVNKRIDYYVEAQKIISQDVPFQATSGGRLDFFYHQHYVYNLQPSIMGRKFYYQVELR